jgi:hypothetical protein
MRTSHDPEAVDAEDYARPAEHGPEVADVWRAFGDGAR